MERWQLITHEAVDGYAVLAGPDTNLMVYPNNTAELEKWQAFVERLNAAEKEKSALLEARNKQRSWRRVLQHRARVAKKEQPHSDWPEVVDDLVALSTTLRKVRAVEASKDIAIQRAASRLEALALQMAPPVSYHALAIAHTLRWTVDGGGEIHALDS